MSVELLRIDQLPYGADPNLRAILQSFTNTPVESLRFRPLLLTLAELSEAIAAPEAYLQDGDQDGYERVCAFAESYRRREMVPAIICRLGEDGYELLDGYHRLAGAAAAECQFIAALAVET